MTTEAPSTQSFLPPFGRDFSRLISSSVNSVSLWFNGLISLGLGQHSLFLKYAFQTLAIDALPRNCYLKDGDLLPFDVILCHPDEELEAFLRLYD